MVVKKHAPRTAGVFLKRAYEAPGAQDGTRVLVDRLWPRGLKKETAAVDLWLKEIAPSTDLRRWFNHDPARWQEFQRRYRKELLEKADLLDELHRLIERGAVTLLFGARDEAHNNAAVLRDVLRVRA